MSPALSLALVTAALTLIAAGASGCGGSSGGSGGATTTSSTAGEGGSGGSGGGTMTSTTFPCKSVTCKRGAEVCTVTSHFSQDDMGECTPLPLPCVQQQPADCSCFGDLMGCTCQLQPSGDFAVFCDVSG